MAEIELKLNVPAQKLPALRQALADLAGTEVPPPDRLVATYFDTPTQRLLKNGMTLRVRREGDRRVQTVKAEKRGLLKRGEWEDAVRGNKPDLKLPSGRRVARLVRGRLRPQFRVTVERTEFNLAQEDARIVVAVDEGDVRAPGQTGEPIHEIELELKDGTPAALTALALRLLPLAPLAIETRTKSARGFALLRKNAENAHKARPLSIAGDWTIEDCLRRLGRHYLAIYLRNAPYVGGDDPEHVHQMRVALRRFRSMLKAFKKALPSGASDWANARLRSLLQTLGPARDWDVFAGEIAAPLRAAAAEPLPRPAAFQRAVTIARKRAHLLAREALNSPPHTETVLQLMHWLESRGWRDTDSKAAKRLRRTLDSAAGAVVHRQYERARKRGRNFATLPVAARHQFRIALKDLRYTVDLLAPLLPRKSTRRFVEKTLKPLQDDLGRLNDIATARALLAELAKQDGQDSIVLHGGVVIGWHERKLAAAEARLCKRVAAFCTTERFW